MTFSNFSKLLSRSLTGAVGLSTVVLSISMSAPAAYAGVLRAGFDFWKTTDGTFVDLSDIIPGGVIPAGAFMMDGMSSDALDLNQVYGDLTMVTLNGHPIGQMGFPEPEQETVVCFDMHGNAAGPDSIHAVQCLPNPDDPVGEPLEWADTIVERKADSAQLSKVGDMAIIPIQLRKLSLVGDIAFQVTFDGGQNPKDVFLKVTQAEDQLMGNLKLTVEGVELMDNMTIISGTPSIGNEACAQNSESFDPNSPNFVPDCLGLPVAFEVTLKDVTTGDLLESNLPTIQSVFEDGGGDPNEISFSFKKTPEPTTTLATILVGLGSMLSLKHKVSSKK